PCIPAHVGGGMRVDNRYVRTTVRAELVGLRSHQRPLLSRPGSVPGTTPNHDVFFIWGSVRGSHGPPKAVARLSVYPDGLCLPAGDLVRDAYGESVAHSYALVLCGTW